MAVVFQANHFALCRGGAAGGRTHFQDIEPVLAIESQADDGSQLRYYDVDLLVAVAIDIRGSGKAREQEQLTEIPTVMVNESGGNDVAMSLGDIDHTLDGAVGVNL